MPISPQEGNGCLTLSKLVLNKELLFIVCEQKPLPNKG